jgi:hypothetical protein
MQFLRRLISGDRSHRTRFFLKVELNPDGWWIVTRPDMPGFSVIHSHLSQALAEVPRAMQLAPGPRET